MDSDLDSNLFSLISELLDDAPTDSDTKYRSLILKIVSLISSTDLESQPKPESKLMSLIKQTISLFSSMDLDSKPEPLSQLISLIALLVDSVDSDSKQNQLFMSLVGHASRLEPEPELISLVYQIISHVIMTSNWGKLISLCPQFEVDFKQGKFHMTEVSRSSNNKLFCLPFKWKKIMPKGEEATHFLCLGCYGKNHEEHEKAAPVEVRHPLHPKHSLQLVLFRHHEISRECYCCDEDLKRTFYYCDACDFAMNIACVVKPPVLTIDHPKRHEHTLALFPRLVSLTCNVCALAISSFAIYMCPPCDFFVHRICINLPRRIRISRHPHRISFTPSFDHGDWSCGICRRGIDNDYGGYFCIKDGCSYAAHSRCATQRNVWDGKELEGEPENIEEEVESFARISDGIIQHFGHQQHHLKLYENTGRDYDENKQCEACITPIYFGNFYSCMQCDFILHEECANIPRKIYQPTHPHMLTLVGGYDSGMDYIKDLCSACHIQCPSGFFYECGKEECGRFKLHVKCATISEPLVHGSHMHPLFLTSKPGERRDCSVCKSDFRETFNCIECNFALCFQCAVLPQRVRYKHDRHMLTLSSWEETTTETYWCEVCERNLSLKRGWFYKCDEYCCVTLHIECLIGKHLYMKPGSSWIFWGKKVGVLPNNQRMSRPICSYCKMRCPFKIVFQYYGFILCSMNCVRCQMENYLM